MAYLPHYSNSTKHAMVTHNDTILCVDCLELIHANATAMEAQFLPALDENTSTSSTTAIAVSISGLLVLLMIGLGVFVFHSYYRNNTISGDRSKGMYKILLLYAYTQNCSHDCIQWISQTRVKFVAVRILQQ